jgi:hypothetical protein
MVKNILKLNIVNYGWRINRLNCKGCIYIGLPTYNIHCSECINSNKKVIIKDSWNSNNLYGEDNISKENV